MLYHAKPTIIKVEVEIMECKPVDFLEWYEEAVYDLQNPIKLPANGANQNKNSYKFYVDSTGEVTAPNDWYNSYLEIEVEVNKKADGTTYATADNITFASDAYSIIRKLNVKYGGVQVIDTPNVNESVAIRNKAEYSRAYLDQATSTLFYPDSGTSTASRTANTGFASKAALTNAAGGVNLIVPLNKHSFFAAPQDVVYQTGKMELNTTLESDGNVLYKDDAAAEGRYVVTKMRLWVPKMELNSAGLNKFSAALTEKTTWGYLADRVETSPVSTLKTGTFDVSSSIEKPRFVMLYAVDSTKDGDVTKNSFHYDTYDIPDGRQVTRAQLELGYGVYYPRVELNPKNELTRVYKRYIEYQKFINEGSLEGTFIDRTLFKDLHSALFFDLKDQRNDMIDGSHKLKFSYSLDGAPTAYVWKAVILYEINNVRSYFWLSEIDILRK